MEPISFSSKKKSYYGWVIVVLSMISISFWFGIRTSFSVFFVALTDDFRWNRADAAAAQSLTMLVYTIMAPITGSLTDRFGSRKIVLPGIVLIGVGLLLCTQTRTLLQFYLFFGVIVGVGMTCFSIVPFTVVLAHWFKRNRGMANGLAGAGIGIGPFLFVPLFQYLISLHGWQFAYLILSLLVLAIPLPLNGFFLKHRPEEVGLLADGDFPANTSATNSQVMKKIGNPHASRAQKEQGLKEMMKTRHFWSLLFFPSFATFGVYVIIVHHVRYLVDLGVDKIWAASLFAGAGALSAGFRFFWGWFSDRVGREITFTLGEICFSFGILFLLLFPYRPSPIFLYLFALLFGIGWAANAPMFMSISADLYKGKNFGLIYGMVEGAIGVGSAFGAWVPGYIFDSTQSYFWAFILIIVFNILSILLVWLGAPQKVHPIRDPFQSERSLPLH